MSPPQSRHDLCNEPALGISRRVLVIITVMAPMTAWFVVSRIARVSPANRIHQRAAACDEGRLEPRTAAFHTNAARQGAPCAEMSRGVGDRIATPIAIGGARIGGPGPPNLALSDLGDHLGRVRRHLRPSGPHPGEGCFSVAEPWRPRHDAILPLIETAPVHGRAEPSWWSRRLSASPEERGDCILRDHRLLSSPPQIDPHIGQVAQE
jgi:hypothetical protein